VKALFYKMCDRFSLNCIFTLAQEAVVLAKWLESITVWIAEQHPDDEHAQLLN